VADIFHEIDEAVRHDRFQKLWKRYGVYVYIVAVALVLGTGGKAAWRHYQEQSRLADSLRYFEASALLTAEKESAAINAFTALADEAGDGYGVIARLREAAARAEHGDASGAVLAYDRLADDDGVASLYRDLARLLAAMRLVDEGAPGEVEKRLAPLLEGDNVWRHSAREIEAVLALHQGRRQDAISGLQALIEDGDTPTGTRARARQLLSALTDGS
jgi:hypothetical protein